MLAMKSFFADLRGRLEELSQIGLHAQHGLGVELRDARLGEAEHACSHSAP